MHAYTLLYLLLVSVKKMEPLVWISRSFAKSIGFPSTSWVDKGVARPPSGPTTRSP